MPYSTRFQGNPSVHSIFGSCHVTSQPGSSGSEKWSGAKCCICETPHDSCFLQTLCHAFATLEPPPASVAWVLKTSLVSKIVMAITVSSSGDDLCAKIVAKPKSGPSKVFQIMSLRRNEAIPSFPKYGYICLTSHSSPSSCSCSASIAKTSLSRLCLFVHFVLSHHIPFAP